MESPEGTAMVAAGTSYVLALARGASSTVTYVDPAKPSTVQQATCPNLEPRSVAALAGDTFTISWGLDLPLYSHVTGVAYIPAKDAIYATLGCSPNYRFQVAKVSADGVFQGIIDFSTPAGTEAIAIAALPSGGVAVIEDEPLVFPEQNVILTILGSNDDVVARARLANTGRSAAVSVESTPDGIVVLTETRDTPNGPLDAGVVLFDALGTLKWQKKYGTGGEIIPKSVAWSGRIHPVRPALGSAPDDVARDERRRRERRARARSP